MECRDREVAELRLRIVLLTARFTGASQADHVRDGAGDVGAGGAALIDAPVSSVAGCQVMVFASGGDPMRPVCCGSIRAVRVAGRRSRAGAVEIEGTKSPSVVLYNPRWAG